MKVATMAVAYREKRFITPHLNHIPKWVDKKVVLVSEKPWFGKEIPDDGTADLARKAGADVIEYHWKTEEEQRNAGLDYLGGYDWVIVLDPDEFLDNSGWRIFKKAINFEVKKDAYVIQQQFTYWKKGYVAFPAIDYQMLVLVKPSVRFVDKRVVDADYGEVLADLHHFSWAKTDEEIWNKITHYAHANDFDTKKWFNEVWKKWKPGVKNVHPTTPKTLHNLIKAKLPPELDKLKLWPDSN